MKNSFFKLKYLFGAAFLLFILTAIPITLKLTEQPKEVTTPKAAENEAPVAKTPEPTFLANELLIKVTKEAKGKIKEDPQDTGISSLTKIFKEHKVKEFSQIAKETKNSLPNHELFQWYKITTEDQPEKVIATLDRVSKKLITKMEERKENSPQKMIPAGQEQALMRLQSIIDKLSKDTNIEILEPNYEVSITNTPNDPYFPTNGAWGQTYPDMWGLQKMNMATAWDQTTGDPNIVVAVIDSGVDRNHPDLASNMWVNSDEIQNNNIDDDNNGYIDDYYGWDFANNDNDPIDDHGHGTHCSGTIGAVGNNALGVVGVNWKTKIMAIKGLDYRGSGYLDALSRALQYAADNGARVSSNSWGGTGYSKELEVAILYEFERGMVTVTAAGNNSMDTSGFSPANSDYVIAVAASDPNDAKASFSNWGEKVDVAAPGVNVLSLRLPGSDMYGDGTHIIPKGDPNGKYYVASGTSMACPHVAGLSALLLAKNPNLNNEEVRQILRKGTDDLGIVGKDNEFGYGRINAKKTLDLVLSQPLTPRLSSPPSRTLFSSLTVPVEGVIGGINTTGSNFWKYSLAIAKGRNPITTSSQWSTFFTSTQIPAGNHLADLDLSKYSDGIYNLRLTVYDQLNNENSFYQAYLYDLEIDNFEEKIEYPTFLVPNGKIDIYGTANTKNNYQFLKYTLEIKPTTSIDYLLLKQGEQPVINGILASWDTSNLADKTSYNLRLSIYGANGMKEESVRTLQIDKDIVLGWPKKFGPLVNNHWQSPALEDIDLDGQKEIVFLTPMPNVELQVYRKDGTPIAGFPVKIPVDANGNNYISSLLNIADIDKDGKPEIIVVDNGLYVFGNQGQLKYNVISYLKGGTWSNHVPTIADINGDGNKDLVSVQINWDTKKMELLVYTVKDGVLISLPSFPKAVIGLTYYAEVDWYSTPEMGIVMVEDLDNDGVKEIGFAMDNKIILLDNNGNMLPGWPYEVKVDGTMWEFNSNPVAGDIDGDGQKELVVNSSKYCPTYTSCYSGGKGYLYAFKKNGTVLTGFPNRDFVNYSYSTEFSPALIDANNDQKLEIIANEAVVNGAGQILFNTPHSLFSFAVSDIDKDGALDIAGNWYGWLNIHNSTGVVKWTRSVSGWFTGQVIMDDLDNNGSVEVAAVTSPYGSEGYPGFAELYLWEIKNGNTGAAISWPMYGHDAQRTGKLETGGIIITPKPSGVLSPTPTLRIDPTSTPVPTRILTPTPTKVPTPTPTPGNDTTPPLVSITSPLNGIYATKRGVVKINVAATDLSGIAKIEIFLDNKIIKTCTNVTTCSYNQNAGKLTLGVHYITAIAYDKAGNFKLTDPAVVINRR